ncbi:hypothetical protein PHLGIDRAFT_91230 [Phlebiopsis gigantea 11061_1 CR5-6]|uniref:ubiquitinyl hydrolase 1 n=1 Tax=Phlebiopsis gigantea (strain 11061_1 CR5-6) TaxID=745531 RepID=A0A0C3PJ85_PHLG1|nr:hypothetical protein PHLGIDRAFT_91230 [Phlebiopsis gigantea 11061_1 CR5-6]
MVLQGLGAVLPWNWTSGSRERKVSEKKDPVVRTRVEQMAQTNGSAAAPSKEQRDEQRHDGASEDAQDDSYYPGIVNISGTYCFMNSTLQALASLSYFQPQIEAIHTRAEELDVPTPVIDAIRDILHELNTSRSSRFSLRPYALIEALSTPGPPSSSSRPRTTNRLFSSREHQDAQELFQAVIEAIKDEATEVSREAGRDLGLGGVLPLNSHTIPLSNPTKLAFDGLTANRRSCVECGYTEAVMHFTFDNWQLALPRSASCDLNDCLADYTRLELLTDCICRRCSLEATYEKYLRDSHPETKNSSTYPSSPTSSSPVNESTEKGDGKAAMSKSKKKRYQETRKLANRVKALLDEGRIEEDVKGVQVLKVTKASTKQAMVARPPPVLVLHLNRSMYFGGYYGASKNSCRVDFSEILDLTPYTTSGMLNTSPQIPMSGPGFKSTMFNSTTVETKQDPATRTMYRLTAVVCHYGQHSFGHYVCFRRRPRSSKLPEEQRWEPPRWQVGDEGSLAALESRRGTGKGWMRISDDDVRECGIESVLQEGSGAFMLYYEKIIAESVQPSGKPESNGATVASDIDVVHRALNGEVAKAHRVYAIEDDDRTPRCSEETLKPSKINGFHKANGSVASLSSTLLDSQSQSDAHSRSGLQGVMSVGLSSSLPKASWMEPRLVRSVSLSARQLGDTDSRPSISRTNSSDSKSNSEISQPQLNGSALNVGHPHEQGTS